MFRALKIAAFAAVAMTAGTPALAQSGNVQAGLLECTAGYTMGMVVASTTPLNCTFKPNTGGQESYAGTLQRVGIDVGFTDKTVLGWAVFAPSQLGKGGLAGQYGGVSANAAIGAGGGANVLVGGSDKTVTLQPLSLQAQTGLNAAATISGLTLKAAAPPRKPASKKKK